MQEKEIKMKIAMLCFTRRGRNLEKDLAEKLRISGHEVLESVKCQQRFLGDMMIDFSPIVAILLLNMISGILIY